PGPPQTQTDCRGCDAQAFGAVLRCAENRQTFRCGDSNGRSSHIKELIAWRTHFHASGRRFTHNSSGQSKNPLTAITVSTAISEMSSQIIPLKDRADFRNSSRILATEIIRV